MKTCFLPLVLSACLLSLPVEPVSGQSETPSASVEGQQKQLHSALNELIDAAVSCMQGIQDEKSASSAPETMTKIMMELDDMGLQFQAAGVEPSEEMMQKMENQSRRIEEEVRRIASTDFYGDKQLKLFCLETFNDVLEDVAEDDIPAATTEVIQKIVESRKETIDRTLADFGNMLKGGPGFTRETAWKIAIKDSFAVRFEYLIMQRMLLMDNKMQSLVEEDGRYYDCHEIVAEVDGVEYVVQQWFDITPYYLEFSKEFQEEENEAQ